MYKDVRLTVLQFNIIIMMIIKLRVSSCILTDDDKSDGEFCDTRMHYGHTIIIEEEDSI